jgi:hypothetical protein
VQNVDFGYAISTRNEDGLFFHYQIGGHCDGCLTGEETFLFFNGVTRLPQYSLHCNAITMSDLVAKFDARPNGMTFSHFVG